MTTIELVTHCFCPKGMLDVYAQHLKWQYASLVQYAHGPVTLTVCYTPTDSFTRGRLEWMTEDVSQREHVRLKTIALPTSQLFRRSIGRNYAAKDSDADVVWFTDVDYCFGAGCLSAVREMMCDDSSLCMPDHLLINTTHEIGQAMVDDNRAVDFPLLERGLFTEREQKICIGGCQIIGGNFAREKGYLGDSEKWQTPVNPAFGFRSCRCDKAFRSHNNLSAQPLPIPEVYRIRHVEDGRDFNVSGVKVGKEAW